MSFAGHIKSRSLFNGNQSSTRSPSVALTARAEKAALQEQVRQKELELKSLRKATSSTELSNSFETNPGHLALQHEGSTTARSRNVDTGSDLVDDRGNGPSRSLWVGNTPSGIRTSDLRAAFNHYGSILSTKCLTDCCFVNFTDIESAIEAWKDCHERDVFECGRPLYIRFTNSLAESRRAKDAQFERTSFMHQPAHSESEDGFQRSPISKVVVSSNDKNANHEWPNGSPPIGPKSHRRAISPPLLTRTSSFRTFERHHHDIYRPDRGHQTSNADDGESPTAEPALGSVRSLRRTGSFMQGSDSLCHEAQKQCVTGSTPSGGLEKDDSRRNATAEEQDQSALIAEAKAKLLRKASTSGVLSSALTSVAKGLQFSAHKSSEHSPVMSRKSELDNTLGDEIMAEALLSRSSPQTLLEPATPRVHEPEPIQTSSGNTASDGHTLTNPQILTFGPALITSINRSPLMLPANKRLKLDRDEISSIRSDKSSLSNSSSRDRKCRGCKKLGNEKGLHMLIKCSSCTRRYHSFCGRPRPDQSSEPSKFTCEKCLRNRKSEQRDVDPGKSLRNHRIFQLASPPLSHGNCDSENGTAYQKQRLPLDFDPRTTPADFRMTTPPTPDATSAQEGMQRQDRNKVTGISPNLQVGDFSTVRDVPRLETFAGFPPAVKDVPVSKRYARVTCPWWKKGNRCRLKEDNCLYSHKDTGILSPDGYRNNRDWTCYYWLQKLQCPDGEMRCRYSHHDTGLHTWKDGRASLKHITCFWWATRGICKHDEDDCRYAHVDTGLYSPDPSDKRAGMAMSSVRPPAMFSSSHRDGGRDIESDFAATRELASESQKQRGELQNLILDHERVVVPEDADESTDYEPESVLSQSTELIYDNKHDSGSLSTQANLVLQFPSNLHFGIDGSSEAIMGMTDKVSRASYQYGGNEAVSKTAQTTLMSESHASITLSTDDAWDQTSKSLPMYTTTTQRTIFTDDGISPKHVPTKDPRKSLHLLQTVNLLGTAQSRSSTSMLLGASEIATDTATSEKPVLVRTQSDTVSNAGANATINSSYKKCRICAKPVFGRETCRECRLNQKNASTSASELKQQQAENISSAPNTPTGDITVENITASVMPDNLHTDIEQAQQNLRQKPVMKSGAKRSVGCDDMFIPNKRQRISMTSSSKIGLLPTGSLGDTTRKVRPPTIVQLLEKRRLEKGANPSPQDRIKEQHSVKPVNDQGPGQSDKENQTPVTEDDCSPLSTASLKGCDQSFIATLKSYPSETLRSVDVRNDKDDLLATSTGVGVATSVVDAFDDSDDDAFDSPHSSQEEVMSDSDNTYHSAEQGDEDFCRSPKITHRQRCAECARRHKRCTHSNNKDNSRMYAEPRDDEVLRSPLSLPLSGPLSTMLDPFRQHKIRQSEGPVSSACKQCRAQHRRCLHTGDGRQLDNFKCRQYLKDRHYVKDTSRSYGEWEEIISAAGLDDFDNTTSAHLVLERAGSDHDHDVPETPPCMDATSTADSTPARTLVDEEHTTHRAQSPEASPDSFAIALVQAKPVGSSDEPAARLQRAPNINLQYDQAHIDKLKTEGVVFESDEDEADYASDDQESMVADARMLADPLRIPPKSSLNLYEICPELHPDFARHTTLVRETRLGRTRTSRKLEWKTLRESRLDERRQLYGNPHWEVCREQPEPKISTLVERLVPILDEEITRFSVPCVEKREALITFREFLGAPKQPEACLALDGALAFRDGAKDSDQTSFARSARGLGRRATDEDKFPVYER